MALTRILIVTVAALTIEQALATGAAQPRTIVVGSEVEIDAVEAFEESHGREPTEKELGALHSGWLKNEALYREGLARQLDKNDDVIRERVISRMRAAIDATLKPPTVTEAQLRDWFESNRARYDEPARYDFQEAVLSGNPAESDVRAIANILNGGTPESANLAGTRVFKNRTHTNIVQSYGSELAREFAGWTPGQWRGVQTRDGWRVLRVDSITPASSVSYERLRDRVLQDWKNTILAEQRSAAMQALVESYRVIYAPPAHHH